jgi:peptide/nickel transport system permease protein
MTKYIFARLLATLPTVLLLLFFVVVLIRLLPGDAVDVLLAESGGRAETADYEEIERSMGLDKSIPEEFFAYTIGLLRGDLGTSLWSRSPVLDTIASSIVVTLELTILSLVVGVLVGVGVGIISAARRGSILDYCLRSVSVSGLTIPNFALATMVIVFPTLWWSWSPPLTYTPLKDGLWPHIYQFITPGLILGFGLSASLMRLTRTSMLETLGQDYIRTARAKGLRWERVVLRHALRNSLIPVVSLLGLQIGALLSGAVLLEQIFGLPGMGRELVTALNTRDYPMIQGIAVVSGLMVIVVNLLVDISYVLIDPRVR